MGWAYLGRLVWAIFPVMVLHALYDTLVGHRDLVWWAFFTAVTIFGLLVYQIETRRWRAEVESRYGLRLVK